MLASSPTTTCGETEVRQRKETATITATSETEKKLEDLEGVKEAFWQDAADLSRKKILSEINTVIKSTLDGMVSQAISCSQILCDKPKDNMDWINDKTVDKRVKGSAKLPEKEFRHRESVLSDLLNVSHIRSVYHIFCAILILLALETMVSDFIKHGSFIQTYHLELFVWVFSKVPETVSCWMFLFLSTLLVYPIFLLWAGLRRNLPKFGLVDYLFLVFYLCYQINLMIVTAVIVMGYDLPPCSSIILGCELTRLMMKIHAFVRSNIPRVYSFVPPNESAPTSRRTSESNCHENLDRSVMNNTFEADKLREVLINSHGSMKFASGSLCPTFNHFLYFLFAPTLIYRDVYPRTSHIRWNYVFSNGLQFIFCVLYSYFVLARFVIPRFEHMDFGQFSWKDALAASTGCMLPGGLNMFIAFFAFLHSWLNMFAELMTFGDRLFYKDWWNSKSFSTYYRTWNVVVHDWLYTYVYLDCFKVFKSRAVGTTFVFVISAYMHEFILCLTFKFFYPVLLIMFGGAGFVLIFVKGRNRFWNITFWASMFCGLGIEFALYTIEWYARKQCQPIYSKESSWLNFVLPHSWYCTIGPADSVIYS